MSKKENAGVFQLENGCWGYRFIVKADGRRKARKRVRDELGNPFKTEKQAAEARQQAMALEKMRLLQPPRKKPGRKKVKAVYKEYCEKGRMDKAFSTKKKQDSLWNNHVRKRFGNRYIDEISVAEINDYLAELYCVHHFSYGYVEGFLKLFYLIFGQAYSRNYMSQDDYNRLCVHKNGRIRMPSRKSADVKDVVSYSKEEIAVMDRYFKGKPVETAYMIGKYAGLRSSECYGLTWDCIDFEEGTIFVEKQLQMQEGVVRLLPLKTANARRRVYMHADLQQYLLALKERLKEYEAVFAEQRAQNEKVIVNIDGTKISSLMLVNTRPNGRIQTEWAIKHHAKPLREKHRIAFRFHNLRHTYGTNLALQNIPAHILSNQMGHSKISTTHQYYLAVSDEGVEVLKDRLNRL